jgi:hypothetical protein
MGGHVQAKVTRPDCLACSFGACRTVGFHEWRRQGRLTPHWRCGPILDDDDHVGHVQARVHGDAFGQEDLQLGPGKVSLGLGLGQDVDGHTEGDCS